MKNWIKLSVTIFVLFWALPAFSGSNLVANPDFELTTNWDDWNTPSVNERTVEQVHAGTYARKITGHFITPSGCQSDAFSLTDGYTINGSIWLYGNGSDSIVVRVQGTGITTHQIYNAVAPASWNQVSDSWISDGNSNDAILVIYVNGSGTFYADDANVNEDPPVSTTKKRKGINNLGQTQTLN